MRSISSNVILGYAGLLVLGGIIGWQRSRARIWLTSSLAAAALLSVAYRVSWTDPANGTAMAAMVALIIALVFAWRLRKSGSFVPAAGSTSY